MKPRRFADVQPVVDFWWEATIGKVDDLLLAVLRASVAIQDNSGIVRGALSGWRGREIGTRAWPWAILPGMGRPLTRISDGALGGSVPPLAVPAGAAKDATDPGADRELTASVEGLALVAQADERAATGLDEAGVDVRGPLRVDLGTADGVMVKSHGTARPRHESQLLVVVAERLHLTAGDGQRVAVVLAVFDHGLKPRSKGRDGGVRARRQGARVN